MPALYDKKNNPDLIEKAKTLLLTPNLLSYLFSGEKANEYTISTTTSLFHIHEHNWDTALMTKLKLPKEIMGNIVMPGTTLGPTLSSIHNKFGMKPVKVIAGAGHDTACVSCRTAYKVRMFCVYELWYMDLNGSSSEESSH